MSSSDLDPRVIAGIAAAALALGVAVFWSRPHGTPTEWTPADHDQEANPAAQGQVPPQTRADPQQESANLTELAWGRNCAACHGPRGRGDGPQGPMLRAPDLTRADWQGRVSDEEIRNTIRNGRNNMPKFDLPAGVVDGLVKRIRANRSP